MKPLNAILTTLAAFFAPFIVEAALDAEGLGGVLIVFLQIGSAIWAFFDAKKIGMKNYKWGYWGPRGPWSAAIGIFLIWLIEFPFYLIRRGKTLEMNKAKREKELATHQACSGDSIAALERLHSLKGSGILTEEEFAREKAKVLNSQ